MTEACVPGKFWGHKTYNQSPTDGFMIRFVRVVDRKVGRGRSLTFGVTLDL